MFSHHQEIWQTGRLKLVYSYFFTLRPTLRLEISRDLSQVKFVCTVRRFCKQINSFVVIQSKTAKSTVLGSFTNANGQSEWSQLTNFDRIQDGVWL